MPADNVLLEILNNRFTGIVEEMGYVIHRASYTVFVKETWDFDSALLTPEGEVFCYPRNIGVTNMLGMHMGAAIRKIGDLAPGDVVVTNDPNGTRGMCTHLPDIMMFRPIFHEGKLLCFAWCFVHSSDVGGLVPGSISPTAYDRFQEGFTIPPTKLYKAGELNAEFLNIFLANCRIPEQNWGDMRALLAALAICERRIGQFVAQYGAATIETGIRNLLDYGERRARDIISAIPDGEYQFTDYVEVDFLGPYPSRIKVNVRVRGSELLLDFTGTDTQVRAAMNLPTHGLPNQWVLLGVVNYLRTADAALPLNRGILRTVRVNIPEGTLLNPTSVAATGVRHASGYRVSDAVLGALSHAVPHQIPAAGAGGAAIILFSHLDPSSGTYKVNVLQPMAGGSGARPTKDGIDGVHFSSGSLRNVPTESIELEAPVLINKYVLADEVGAGCHRGGAAVVFEFQSLAASAIVTARGMDRYRFRPWGRKGADPGTLGETILNPGGNRERSIGKIDVLHLAPADIVRIRSPGGGGYGRPFDRDPLQVKRDVDDGFVSEAEAEQKYGVVIRNRKIDLRATEIRRKELGAQGSAEEFVFGEERQAYERIFPQAVQDAVAALVLNYPPATRQFLRDSLYPLIQEHAGFDGASSESLAPTFQRMIEEQVLPKVR